MTAKRKRVRVLLDVTAPPGMPADKVRREIRTRINDVTGHYDAFAIGLRDCDEDPGGNIEIHVARMRPAR